MTSTLEGINLEQLSHTELQSILAQVAARAKKAEVEEQAEQKAALAVALQNLVEYVVQYTQYQDYGQNGNVWAGYKLPTTTAVIGDETYTVTVSLTDTKRKAFNAAEKAKADSAALHIGEASPVSLVKPDSAA